MEPPDDLNFTDIALRDPLTSVTRKERLYLLAVSVTGIAIAQTGLVPSKIAAFGIELDKPNRSALLLLLALVTVYFLAAFVIYGASDFAALESQLRAAGKRQMSRRLRQEVASDLGTSEEHIKTLHSAGELEDFASSKIGSEQAKKVLRELESLTLGFERGYSERVDSERVRRAFERNSSERRSQWRTALTAQARVFFEFFLPPLVGLYAIYALLFRAYVVPEALASIATFGLIGLVLGLLRKYMLPGPYGGGFIVSMLVGITGAFIGSLGANTLLGAPGILGINPISVLAATLGAVTSLGVHQRLIWRKILREI